LITKLSALFLHTSVTAQWAKIFNEIADFASYIGIFKSRTNYRTSNDGTQQGECQQQQSCHIRGPKIVTAQTAEITKFHVIFGVCSKS
jgi:hypothetical protein